ncbi:MAG: LysR family transcriptional regulator, partial [Halobacteriovoraceae bacterium]|nr:LysR family transcriptional regulator [Halobacteriovoraceae bacterium]
MEMNEIRYFTAVAETQNIHRASENIGISPSSLSKAISKLEEELKVKLFSRLGRNIILTTEGIYLKEKAHQILNIETQTKLEI